MKISPLKDRFNIKTKKISIQGGEKSQDKVGSPKQYKKKKD